MPFEKKVQVVDVKAAQTTTDADVLQAAKANIWQPGRVLPDGAEKLNPAAGDPDHRCIDLQRRYQPTWKCIYVNKGQDTPDLIPIPGPEDKIWQVRTGVWVDVPPFIVEALRRCVETTTETKETGLATGGMEFVKQSRPRFSLHCLDSA